MSNQPKGADTLMKLHLQPSPLMGAFYAPEVVIDGGRSRDIEDTACKLFLMWQVEYPDYSASLAVAGRPLETAALNGALFA